MSKRMAGSTMRVLSVVLVLALLVLASGLASAQPRSVTASFIQDAKLTASDGAEDDSFGRSVSISGDTLVVGAPADDDMGGNSGSAYLFERDEGGADKWGQVAKLLASDGDAGDLFGHSVSINGDTVVVGAREDDDNGDSSGSAYVFERNEGGPGNWGQVAKLIASDSDAGDWFGHSVSISGDTAIVGSPVDDDMGGSSGSAYLFGRDEGGADEWGQVAKLIASDGESSDFFGMAVSINGDTVVVGAQDDDDHGDSSGSAYVFVKPESGWPESVTETAKLTASDGGSGDWFGRSVSIHGDTLIVGATRDGLGPCCSGWAYLFDKPESGWADMTETAKLTPSDGEADYDIFGGSVSISGDTVLVGAIADDPTGSVYVFEKPDAGWTSMTETTKLTVSDGAVGDRFGDSVSVDGDTLVVGASWDDDMGDASGSAYVFGPFDPVSWVYLPVVLRGGP